MLNGETLRSFKTVRGRAANPASAAEKKVCGFAGIFGLSALLTGGGTGDLDLGLLVFVSSPGVGALVEDLLLC